LFVPSAKTDDALVSDRRGDQDGEDRKRIGADLNIFHHFVRSACPPGNQDRPWEVMLNDIWFTSGRLVELLNMTLILLLNL